MAVTLFTDRRMLDHRVPARHPERPERLQAILRHLERTGYLATCPQRAGARGDCRLSWARFIRPSTCNGSPSWKPRAAACSTRIPGSSRVEPGGPAGGRCVHRGGLVRDGRQRPDVPSVWSVPRATMPGRPRGWGFASTPTSHWPRPKPSPASTLNRILIADFDVHHGNGTQEIFYDSGRVGFLSIHRYPFYPGTGARR